LPFGVSNDCKKAFDEKWVDLNTQISYNEMQRKAVLSVALGDAVFERGGALRRDSMFVSGARVRPYGGQYAFSSPKTTLFSGFFFTVSLPHRYYNEFGQKEPVVNAIEQGSKDILLAALGLRFFLVSIPVNQWLRGVLVIVVCI
jgi:hypothetical protein